MKSVELGSVASVSWGDTSTTKKSYIADGYPAYSATGQDGFLPNYDFEEPGIVLSAIGARCGKCFKTDKQWKAIKNTITITTSPGSELDLDYLFYIANDENFWPKRGVAQPFIGLGDARKVQIPLPPLDEQKRIAAILDAADHLRAKRREAIQQLDELLQATFLDLFGDPVTNPKGWEVAPFSHVVLTMHQGINTAADKVEYANEGIPIIQSKHISDGDVLLENLKLLGPSDSKKYGAKYTPKVGDILFANIGTIGKSAIVVDSQEFMFAWNVFLIRPQTDLVAATFVKSFLDHLLAVNFYQKYFTGGTVKFVSKKVMSNIRVPLPPLALQQQFADIVSAVEEQKARYHAQLDELDTLFASLQSRAFKGEL